MALNNPYAIQVLEMARNALRRQDEERNGVVYPARDLTMEYPATDPRGMYDKLDMDIKNRMERLKVYLEIATPMNWNYAQDILNSEKMLELGRRMKRQAAYARDLACAMELCEEGSDARAELQSELEGLSEHPDVQDFHSVLHCLEYVLGATDTAPPSRNRLLLAEMGVPPAEYCMGVRKAFYLSPERGLTVALPSLPEVLRESDRHHFARSEENKAIFERGLTLMYTEELGRRAFAPFAAAGEGDISLEDRVLIGTRTGRELVEERQAALGRELSSRERENYLYQFLGAALTSGEKIDLFPPLGSDENGRRAYSRDPIQVNRSKGWRDEQYTMGLWEWILSVLRLSREKWRKEDAYSERMNKMVQMVEKMQKNGDVALVRPDAKLLTSEGMQLYRDAREVNARIGTSLEESERYRLPFQAQVLRVRESAENPRPGTYRFGRAWHMIPGMLLKDGNHALEEVLDPSQLQEEKEAALQELVQRVKQDDLDWYTRTMTEGMDAALRQLEEEMKQLDVKNEDALLAAMPRLMLLGEMIHNGTQELEHGGIRERFVGMKLPKYAGKDREFYNTEEGRRVFAQALQPYTRAYTWVSNLETMLKDKTRLLRNGLGQPEAAGRFPECLGRYMAAAHSREYLAEGLKSGKALGEIPAYDLGENPLQYAPVMQDLENFSAQEMREVARRVLGNEPHVLPGRKVNFERSFDHPYVEYKATVDTMETELEKLETAHASYIANLNQVMGTTVPEGLQSWREVKDVSKVFSLDRTMPQHLCMVILLNEGHTMEEILDPAKLTAEKKDTGNRVRQHIESGDVAWMAENMAAGLEKVSTLMEREIREICTRNLQFDRNYMLARYATLYELGRCAHDLQQETDRSSAQGKTGVREYLNEKYGEEKRNAIQSKANAFAVFTECLYQGFYQGREVFYRAALGKSRRGDSIGNAYMAILKQDYAQRLYQEKLLQPDVDYDALGMEGTMIMVAPQFLPQFQETSTLGEDDFRRKHPEKFQQVFRPLAEALFVGEGPKVESTRMEDGIGFMTLNEEADRLLDRMKQIKNPPQPQPQIQIQNVQAQVEVNNGPQL